ncbi:MAG: methionine synthase, partial [Limnochordia bacterium]
MSEQTRVQLLREALRDRILVLDGAMGTVIQQRGLTAADYGHPDYEGCHEYLVKTRPDLILAIHEEYLRAGADIIETNTFGSGAPVLAEYGLADQAYALTYEAARLARRVADSFTTTDRPRFVAGSMGPTTKSISVTGGIGFDELVRAFREQARALVDGGVDYLLLETCQDTRNIKAGLVGIQGLWEELGGPLVPVAVSVTVEPGGTMLAGQDMEALITSLEHADLLYLGLNCATGPELMTDHLRALGERAAVAVACVPNAGLPDEEGHYGETPEQMVEALERFAQRGWLNVVGGCCGTTSEHIRLMAKKISLYPPRRWQPVPGTFVSGITNLEIAEDNRPVLVGERANVIGSRRFRRLIHEGRYEEAAEVTRRQERHGAQIVDICVSDPDRDEVRDMESLLSHVIRLVKAPLMIDSTEARVIERALTYCQGKAIINSVNLEDGERRIDDIVPLMRRYGAALVVGLIDEEGMAVSRQRKLEIARRAHDILVHKHGIQPANIIFDPLVFPCATGDRQYAHSARETIEGLRLIKQAFPACKTVLGISNVSFGLPPAAREVLNSVFLFHCTEAGLDLAIVNTERLRRYAGLAPDEKELAARVLFQPDDEVIAAFAGRYRHAETSGPQDQARSLDERLARYIVEGTKDGLFDDLAQALKEATPMEIINGSLLKGMEEVGRLFKRNELIVTEVLTSAEVMKAAVAFLQSHIDQAAVSPKGTVVLATVQGDVHDIGKNLVEMVLSNNGYRVIDLGVKVPPAALIQAVREHKPDLIGLSGLLVRSAHQMVMAAEALSQAGLYPPMLVGGAALTDRFTRKRIAPAYQGPVAYACDVMQGLELANQIMDPDQRRILEDRLALETANPVASTSEAPKIRDESAHSTVSVLERLPQPADFDRHVLTEIDPDEIWRYMNPVRLYRHHLGLKGPLGPDNDKALQLREQVQRIQDDCRQGLMQVAAIRQFFPAAGQGDYILLFDTKSGEQLVQWELPRQSGRSGLCLADYVSPRNGRVDSLCLFVVTAGRGIAQEAARLKDQGEYVRSHILQALAIETAEAASEWLHAQIRSEWGFGDSPDVPVGRLWRGEYRGRRYSFGYGACP